MYPRYKFLELEEWTMISEATNKTMDKKNVLSFTIHQGKEAWRVLSWGHLKMIQKKIILKHLQGTYTQFLMLSI